MMLSQKCFFVLIDFLLYQDILIKSSKQSRIIAICASTVVVRDIMLTASEMGMLESGEYVFINVDLFSSNLLRPWQLPDAENEENQIARTAFQHVLTISSSKNVNGNFHNFKQRLETVADTILPNSSSEENFVNSFVANYYDAVKIFSSALQNQMTVSNRQRFEYFHVFLTQCFILKRSQITNN